MHHINVHYDHYKLYYINYIAEFQAATLELGYNIIRL